MDLLCFITHSRGSHYSFQLLLLSSLCVIPLHTPPVSRPRATKDQRGSTRNTANGIITLDRCQDFILTSGVELKWGQGKK